MLREIKVQIARRHQGGKVFDDIQEHPVGPNSELVVKLLLGFLSSR